MSVPRWLNRLLRRKWPRSEVWPVTSYELGGNAGYVVEAVFTTRERAEFWCAAATALWQSKWPHDTAPYTVDEPLALDPSELP